MPRGKSYFLYAVVAALSLILVGLAALQYRWSNQVSQAEHDRMEASLRIATTQFRQDFSRELQTLCSGLQPSPELLTEKDWDGYASQSSEWLKNSNYPDLVSALFLWRPNQPLARLDRVEMRWNSSPEPAALASVLQRIHTANENSRQFRGFRAQTWSLDGNVPAISHGLYVFPDPEDRRGPNPPELAGFTIILLNREFLQSKLLPDLATRHFGGPNGFLYQVGVFAAGDANRPIYRSSPALNQGALASADVAVDLVDIRQRPGGPPPSDDGRGPGGPPPDEPRGGFGKRFRRRGGSNGERSFNQPNSNASRNGFALQERLRVARRLGVIAPPPTIASDARTSWKLVVRHRAGSVDAAVAGLRLRNLAVSFAILVLLAASMALIIIATQQAQRLARLQVEFVAGVSHELRTPLAVISSAAENLTDGIVDGKAQVKLYGTLIRNEARRLESMMEHILEFASGQNRRTYDPRLLNMNEVIDRALSFCSTSIHETQFVVEKHVAPNLAPVLAEEAGIVQCLQNMIANAVKYGGENRWIGIDARMDGAHVLVSVADRGLGIESQDLPYLFDAFYRGRAATEAQIHGTGLGLSLAKSFVEAAGGTINVKSSPGDGSCFMIRLPAAKPALTLQPQALAGRTV